METTVIDIETGINEERFDALAPEFKKNYPHSRPFDPTQLKLGNVIRDTEARENFIADLASGTPVAQAKDKLDEKIAGKAYAAVTKAQQDHHAEDRKRLSDWEQEQLEHAEKWRDKAALYPLLSEVVAIGWQIPDQEPVTLIVGKDVEDERELMKVFRDFHEATIEASRNGGMPVKFGFWSGNNHSHSFFDWVHLREAFRRHRINPGAEFDTSPANPRSRWRDLSADFFQGGAIHPDLEGYPAYLSLNKAVSWTGGWGQQADSVLTCCNKDDMDVEGATFAEWVRTGKDENIEKARAYLVNDLALTRWVANLQVGLL